MEENANQAKQGTMDLDKELSEFANTLPQTKRARTTAAAKKIAAPKKKTSKKAKVVVQRGKRKEAIARASMSQGSGRITINGQSANLIKPKEIRDLILEPITISSTVTEMMKGYDVSVNVSGGGIMGQAQAVRTALAKAIVESSQNEGLRRAYMLYDRNILIEDHRRVEPKKMGGPKARARNQTSYR